MMTHGYDHKLWKFTLSTWAARYLIFGKSATCSHLQPLEWPQVTASDRREQVTASDRKCPQVTASDRRETASDRREQVTASGRKWPQVTASSVHSHLSPVERPQVTNDSSGHGKCAAFFRLSLWKMFGILRADSNITGKLSFKPHILKREDALQRLDAGYPESKEDSVWRGLQRWAVWGVSKQNLFAHVGLSGAEQFIFSCALDDTLHVLHTSHMSNASVHALHMPKPNVTPCFKVLRNGLLRYILYTCANLM